jgi:uncharacterized protein YndB with AHSA1/START domain
MTRVASSQKNRAVKPRAGGFAISASKTIAASAPDIFAAWSSPRRRARWLSGVKLLLRAAIAPKSLHLTCTDDGTSIEVVITARGRGRCIVAVDHTRLADAKMVAERRHCWKEMLAALKHYLERPA